MENHSDEEGFKSNTILRASPTPKSNLYSNSVKAVKRELNTMIHRPSNQNMSPQL